MDKQRPVDRGGEVVDLGGEVYEIDTRMSGYTGITAAYLIAGPKPCLIETGTASSAATVTAALSSVGIGPGDLASIVVTHVHLDHAGGAGDLARAFPRAQVFAHSAGVRHLVDPERLLSSARRVFGSVLDDVFGLLLPVGADRVRSLDDGSSIDLGAGRMLTAYDSPGHAKHHVGLLDSGTGDLYVGDAAGIFIPATGDLHPATPPPDFDYPTALDSLRRFAEAQPTRLMFSHYGPVPDPAATLAHAEEEMRIWVEAVRSARGAHDGHDTHPDHALAAVQERTRERYERYAADPARVEKFEHLNAPATNVAGINRWLDGISPTQ